MPNPNHRRNFITQTLAVGYALATQHELQAAPIQTAETDLTTQTIKINGIPAYCAMPTTGKAFPVLLVVQEIFGVHEHIRDVCRRFARQGYMAIAPELFARYGNVSKISSVDEILKTVVSQVPDAEVLADLDAAVTWAKNSGKANIQRLGITGFCWGGRITWLYAAHNPGVKAGVAWYGRLVGEKTERTPSHPVDIAAQLYAPVKGLYGGADTGIPQETIERMRTALKTGSPAAQASEITVFPEAPHAFFADYRPSYRAEAATDAWKLCLIWLKQYGV